ncbi:MAG: hypothetical protein ACLTW7_14805 [Enterococcus sp.]|uniref:hypothetical protein n=1 Tax=Enterococcus sp. TaxID=35783 RepID=UPI0039953103
MTFTMYYSPTKPIRDDQLLLAEVFDVVKGSLISGNYVRLNSSLRQGRLVAMTVSNWRLRLRVCRNQTDYGIPSEMVHVPSAWN